ncbi:unnamed protein product, partial [Brenthis ino]
MESYEFYVEAPWGKIACISWGHCVNSPVLMVHGYMDSAATFIPIMKHLPNTYYYVAIDFPGQGKSDAFPLGPLVNHACLVEAMRRVIEHLKWPTFVLMAHSVGFVIGAFYNSIHPYRISKMINLDPLLPLSTYTFHETNPALWYQYMYDHYYDNYSRWSLERNKKYTYDQAINLLVRSRKLTKDQSAVVLSRSLVPLDDGMYKLSWEPCMKQLVVLPVTKEMLISLVTTNPPPMLNIVAFEVEILPYFKKNGIRLMEVFKKSIPNFIVHNVAGPHDVHITNPESFVDKIIDFLDMDFKVQAKL